MSGPAPSVVADTVVSSTVGNASSAAARTPLSGPAPSVVANTVVSSTVSNASSAAARTPLSGPASSDATNTVVSSIHGNATSAAARPPSTGPAPPDVADTVASTHGHAASAAARLPSTGPASPDVSVNRELAAAVAARALATHAPEAIGAFFLRGASVADGDAPHAHEGAGLYAYTAIVSRNLASVSENRPVQLFIDSGTDAALVFTDSIPPFVRREEGSWTVKGLGSPVACTERVTLPVTVFSITAGSVADTHRFDVVAYVLPTARPTIGGFVTDVVLPPVFSQTGPLASLFAARVAKVNVETIIPKRSATPTDAHTLHLCGLDSDDDDDDGFPDDGGDPPPTHSSPSAFRSFIEAAAKIGVAYNHSDSITWLRPPANPHWPPGNPEAWEHGLPPTRPASAPSSPFPPPERTPLEQRLQFFRDGVPYVNAVEPADRERLIALLCKHQAAFEPLNANLPAKHSVGIDIKPGATPIRARCRPVNPRIFAKVERLINEAVNKGILRRLRPGENPAWLTPLVAARKPRTDDYRLCWDFKALNAATTKKHVDLPTVTALLEATAGYDMFSVMDLQQSFHQVGLDDAAQLLCAVTTPWGNFAVTRMAMGLINSPCELQNLVDKIFNDFIIAGTVSCYIDDILVKTKGNSYREIIDNHLAALDHVLQLIVEAGLLVNLHKSCFLSPCVSYLGNIVSKYKRSVDPARLQGLRELGPVTDLASARTLIGILVHHQNFCPMLQSTLGPLHDFVKQSLADKAAGRRMSRPPPEALAAQKAATDLVLRGAQLRQPDPTRDFFIATDASLAGAGAVLQQASDDGVLQPVAYASHRFSPVQSRWGVSDREAFGVLLAFQRWGHLLRHSRCIVITDHKDLLSWATSASPRIVRWSNFLNRFDISISWAPGSTNVVPDILSRLQPGYGDVIGCFYAADVSSANSAAIGGEPNTASAALSLMPPSPDTDVGDENVTVDVDPTLLHAIAAAQTAPEAADERARASASGYLRTGSRNGVDIATVGRGDSPPIWVPQHAVDIHNVLLQRAHERAGHRHGRSVFNTLIDSGVAWVGMSSACDKHASACSLCNTSQSVTDRFPHGRMGDFSNVANAPGDLVVGDFLGPYEPVDFEVYPGVTATAKYILVLVDHYSRCTWLHPVPAADSKSAIHALRAHFRLAGPPVAWRSDNAPFGSKEFLAFLKQNNIRADLSMPRHPQSNGVVERRNADIVRLQRVLVSLGHSWVSFLEHSEWVLQTTRSAAHDHTPFQVFYGMAPNTALSRELGAPRPAFSSYYEREAYVQALRNAVDTVHERALVKRRHDHDARIVAHGIMPGDNVKIWLPDVSAKLDHRLELARVVERADVNGEAYVVQPVDLSTAGTDALQALKRVVHVDRLKRIPTLRDVTDDDKPAFYLRRVKDGLGTVEAIFEINIARKKRNHTVNVKWLHVDEDVARENGLTTIPASKLKRNDVLRDACVAYNINFKALTHGGDYTSVRSLPASAIDAPEFNPTTLPASSAAGLDALAPDSATSSPSAAGLDALAADSATSAASAPDDYSDTDDDSRYLRYIEVGDKIVPRAKLVPIHEWTQQQYALSITAPAPTTLPSPTPRSRPRASVRYAPGVDDPAPRTTRTGRISRAPSRSDG